VKKALFLAAVALAAVLLFACKAGPDYVRPDAPGADAFREAGDEWKVAQPRDEIERGRWWEIFNDPQLSALVERVNVSNQTLAASEAQYRQAEAALSVARSAYFPPVDANASVVKSRSPVGVSGGTTAGRIVTQRSVGLSSNWEIDLWGRLRRLAESAEASAEASAGDVASARLSLQAQLATSYFQLRVLDVQKRLFDDTVDAYRKNLELTNNRYAVGVAAKSDIVQADAQLKSTLVQAVDIGVQRAQLEHAIAVLTGAAPSTLALPRQPTYDAVLPVIPPGLPSALLERRPDVAAAERRMAAANAQIGAAKAAYFPSLTLQGTAGFRSIDAANWLTAPAHFWTLGPALAMNIFDAGLRRAQTQQAIAAYDGTVANYRATALTALQEVEDNLAALRILEEEAKVEAEAVDAARQSVQLTINQYKAGTVSYLNVVTVQAQLLAEERNAVNLLNRRLAATVALVKAIGGGWQPAK
jgi:NodT family efflux transporter outer membrane factor (OMF) lipoprotein